MNSATERRKARHKAWVEANREKVREYSRAWRRRNWRPNKCADCQTACWGTRCAVCSGRINGPKGGRPKEVEVFWDGILP